MEGKFLQDRQAGADVGVLDYIHQQERETEMVANGAREYRKRHASLVTKGQEDRMTVSARFLRRAMSQLVPAVENLQELALMKLGTRGKLEDWVPLVCIDAARMAYLTAHAAFAHRHKMDAYDDGYDAPTPRPVLSLALEVARQIVRERQFDVWAVGKSRAAPRDVAGEVEAWVETNVRRIRKHHHERICRIRNVEKALGVHGSSFARTAEDSAVKAAVRLLEVLVDACPDHFARPTEDNSFVLVQRRGKRYPEQHVILTEQAQRMLEHQHEKMARPTLMCMLCPPRAWQRDPDSKGYVGGYYHLDDLRLLSGRSYRSHSRDLTYPVGTETLKAVNAVQATAWRINHRVAGVLRRVAESGYRERLGLGPSERTRQRRRCPYNEWKAMSPQEQADYDYEHREKSKGNARRQLTSRLLAAIGEDETRKAIWFPHFLDFRGRMYPYPQDLEPQASDPVRACLQFAEGKPIGLEGESWLKRQIPASYGGETAGKALGGQLAWVDKNKRAIDKLVQNPLGEIEFWETARYPWRFLAACCEWAEMHRKGAKFISHLPVAMDGRCNGLQHLAALGRDRVLGELVNITPAPDGLPRDVYQVIADELRAVVRAGTSPGALAWQKRDDLISRDTVKRPVMTFPFGVTQEGFEGQILNDGAVYKIPHSNPERDARYLAGAIKKVTQKTGGVLSRAKGIMDWLAQVAKAFARAGAPVNWTNPAGMQIRLAYYQDKSRRIELHGLYRAVSIKYYSEDRDSGLNTRKQGQGITASLVHSFDAAHLAKTVNACVRAGIHSFAAVHDSYSTHANDAPVMARLLREQFMEIYSKPWLEQLAQRWRQEAPPRVKVSDPPERGDLAIDEVIDSDSFFC